MTTFLQPFTRPAVPSDRVLVRADGVRVYDSQGREYIDGLASLWYCQVGHNRGEIIEAIHSQMNILATYNSFAPFSVEISERAADRIADVSPFQNPRVFLCCSGSESIDTALK
ncbi:MAG: aspartate aminotransferase family protein, partial [Acidimicrobiales bacterium]|nr:aspartate aminotransferase family protein [Acidimicrobiales bacterium]